MLVPSRGSPAGQTHRRLTSGGRPLPKLRPFLPVAQILAWADAHKGRTGSWPTLNSGPVHGVDGETWYNVNAALRDGWRGLPGGDSLFRLLVPRRGLLGNDLLKFVEMVQVARRCRRIIWFNFAGTLAVDSIGMGLAGFGMLNPLFAAFITSPRNWPLS
jgi:hypothetical protein